jgi:hypothetical protein
MTISLRVARQRAYADRLWIEQQVDRAERHPTAGLAQKMFPSKGPKLLKDYERGALSPLGGLAKGAKR